MHYALDVRRYNNIIAGYCNDVSITTTVRKLQRLIISYYYSYYRSIVYRAIAFEPKIDPNPIDPILIFERVTSRI